MGRTNSWLSAEQILRAHEDAEEGRENDHPHVHSASSAKPAQSQHARNGDHRVRKKQARDECQGKKDGVPCVSGGGCQQGDLRRCLSTDAV